MNSRRPGLSFLESILTPDLCAVPSDGGEVQTLTTGGDCDIWYLYDANGNVGQLLRYDAATGGVTLAAAYEYDPYGNTLAVNDVDDSGIAQANKFRFSTKYLHDELTVWGQPGALDTTGLYYYGYRFYSPSLGRWVSRDKIEEAGGFNLYAALKNQPVDRVDTLGNSTPATRTRPASRPATTSCSPPRRAWTCSARGTRSRPGWR